MFPLFFARAPAPTDNSAVAAAAPVSSGSSSLNATAEATRAVLSPSVVQRLDALPYYLVRFVAAVPPSTCFVLRSCSRLCYDTHSFDVLGGDLAQNPEAIHVYFPSIQRAHGRENGVGAQFSSRSFQLRKPAGAKEEQLREVELEEENTYFCFFMGGQPAHVFQDRLWAKGKAIMGEALFPRVLQEVLPPGLLSAIGACCFALKKRGALGLYLNNLPLVELLRFLEYYGYDSAVLSTLRDGMEGFADRLWDVGLDVVPSESGSIQVLRTSFFSVL